MLKVTKQLIPKKFEMLKAQKQPSTTKFFMGKKAPLETKKFEMLGNKAARPLTGF